MAENVSLTTDLWKSQLEFNEKLSSDLDEIQEMMDLMMDMIRGRNKSSSSQIFQSPSSVPVACETYILPSLEVGLLVDEFGHQSPLKLEGPGAAHNLFDKMPSPPSKTQKEGNDNNEDAVLPVVCLSQVMDTVVDIKEAELLNSSSKTKLGTAYIVFDEELAQALSSQLNHLDGNEKLLAPLENGDQRFGCKSDEYGFTDVFWKARREATSINLEAVFCQNVLENETFKLFDKIHISTPDIKTPRVFSDQTMELIKCKCKNPTLLIDNDVAFYFDPGGSALSQMDCEFFKLLGELGGLSLASGLAPNATDALVKAISHEPWIREAYGYGDVIEYSRTKMEFVGERSARNALMAWSPIDRDCEGWKINHVILRNVLDSFVVISSKNVCVCVVDGMLMFIFDPGGSSLFYNGCDHFESNVEQGNYCLATNMNEFMNIGVLWIICQEYVALQSRISTCAGWYYDSYHPINLNNSEMWAENWIRRFKSCGSLDPSNSSKYGYLKQLHDVLHSIE